METNLQSNGPAKVFCVLSGILAALTGLFYGLMLVFNFTDAGEYRLLMLGFLFLAASALYAVYRIPADLLSDRRKIIGWSLAAALLLMAQLRFVKAIYGNIAYDFNYLYVAARGLAWEGTLGGVAEYFARFPNNLFLALAFAVVVKLATLFGVTNLMAVLTVCSVAAVDAAVVLTWFCAKKISPRAPRMFFLFSVPMILFHYGIVNPYSDTFGMLIPPLLLFLYLYMPQRKPAALAFSSLMGLTAAIGYKIKPQTVIMAIAIILAEVFYERPSRERFAALGKGLLCFALALAVSTSGLNFLIRAATRDAITPEMIAENETPFTHYLMMGLNPDTGGFISSEDYSATNALKSREEKIAYNLQVAGQRLGEMGPVGYARFLIQKGRSNFNSIYMDSWVRSPFPSEDPLSRFIQQNFCQGGSGFKVYMQFLEAIWVLLLVLWILPLVLRPKSWRDKTGTVLRLAVMGYTIFQLLFEGGPRYKFHLFPIFILLAVWGVNEVFPAGRRNASFLKFTFEGLSSQQEISENDIVM